MANAFLDWLDGSAGVAAEATRKKPAILGAPICDDCAAFARAAGYQWEATIRPAGTANHYIVVGGSGGGFWEIPPRIAISYRLAFDLGFTSVPEPPPPTAAELEEERYGLQAGLDSGGGKDRLPSFWETIKDEASDRWGELGDVAKKALAGGKSLGVFILIGVVGVAIILRA